jgi:hypothetical protein
VTVDLGPLVDHHCHGLVVEDLDRAGFEALMNEATRPSPLGTTLFDSMLGLAIRRHCAPLLDLEPLATADEYLARVRRWGRRRSTAGWSAAAGIEEFLVDTGASRPRRSAQPDDLADLAGGQPRGGPAGTHRRGGARGRTADFPGEVRQRLEVSRAVGAKSIAAYRVGLALPRPSRRRRSSTRRWPGSARRGS